MNNVNPASLDKPYLRDFYLEKRKNLSQCPDRKTALDDEIQTRLIISSEYRNSDTVLVYMARPFEIATSMIIHAALANNKTVGLPVCLDDHRMIFRKIISVADLCPGRFGILEPPQNSEKIIPDEHTLCVCPCLCCDMNGMRLGFGGGYYDRFLSDFNGVKAALCYGDSVLPAIEGDDFDVPMNVIVTDSFIRNIR